MSGWHIERLKRLASVRVSNVDKKSDADQASVKLCNYTDVYYNDVIDRSLPFMQATATAEQVRDFVVQAGDVLITKDSETAEDIAVPAFVSSDLQGVLCGYHLAQLRPIKAKVIPKYLFWWLSSAVAKDYFSTAATGVTRFGLRADSICNAVVDLPSLSIQSGIADFLDAETARLDSLIERKHRLVKRLGDREHFFLETVFRNQATSEVPLRRLLKVPPQYGASESGLSGEADWPRYIRITDLRDDGVLADDDVKRLPPETAHPYLLQHGDVLVARSGATVGKSIMYRELLGSACFAGYLIRLRFDSSKTLPALIELWMRTSHYWDQIAEAALQATIQNVSAEKYKELSVPVIPLAEQHQVIERLTRLRSRVRQTQTLLERQIVLLTEHRQALITAAIIGHLEIPGAA